MLSSNHGKDFSAATAESTPLLGNSKHDLEQYASVESVPGGLQSTAVPRTPFKSLILFGIVALMTVVMVVFTAGKVSVIGSLSNADHMSLVEIQASERKGRKIMKWVMGNRGESCDDVCDDVDGTCYQPLLFEIEDPSDLRSVYHESRGIRFKVDCDTQSAPYYHRELYYYCNKSRFIKKMRCREKESRVQRVCPCRVKPTDAPTMEPTIEPTMEATTAGHYYYYTTEPTTEPTAYAYFYEDKTPEPSSYAYSY